MLWGDQPSGLDLLIFRLHPTPQVYIYIPPLHAAPPLKHAPDLGPKLQEVVSWGPEN